MMVRLLALGLLAAACGSPPPPAYVTASQHAEAARRRGDHAGAARHYERAAALADSPRDADEARYRAAEAYAQGGELERALSLHRALAQGQSERAARSEFALAELLRRSGRHEGADAQRLRALRRHPSSGLARAALREHLAQLRERGGSEAVLAFLDREARTLGSSELAEELAYRRARELDDAGRVSEARDAYLACATAFPYPGGSYWDDALYRAAEQELKLGAPERALLHLSRLLGEREVAHIAGSYERGRYAEAQLKIAEIYRDALHDNLRARRELRKVWQEHRKSRLSDDALFEEARLAREAGDALATCEPLRLLVTELKDSRYVPCAVLLCPSLHVEATATRVCHDYIKRAADLP